jgi:hypothetical protein
VVPLGAPVQLKGGETPKLSQVYFFGNLPLLTNALLLATRLELVVVVVELVVELSSFWQEVLVRQTNRMIAETSRLIVMILNFKVDQKYKIISRSKLLTIKK